MNRTKIINLKIERKASIIRELLTLNQNMNMALFLPKYGMPSTYCTTIEVPLLLLWYYQISTRILRKAYINTCERNISGIY